VALEYTTRTLDSVTLVTLKGTIAAGEAVDTLHCKTQALIDTGANKIILDFAEVTYVDSAGIGTLIRLAAAAMPKGGSLRLLNLTKHIHDALQISRLSSVFEIYDDLQKAIASFAPQAKKEVAAGEQLKTVFLPPDYLEEKPQRRTGQRWYIPVPIRVKGVRLDGSAFEEETIAADVSPTGMCILLTVAAPTGGEVFVSAPDEKFESPATVIDVGHFSPHMNRVRVRFPGQTVFCRAAAEKKYVYDYSADTWVAYILGGIYYDTKHQPFARVEGQRIVSLDSGAEIFRLRLDCVYDLHMTCIGHLI